MLLSVKLLLEQEYLQAHMLLVLACQQLPSVIQQLQAAQLPLLFLRHLILIRNKYFRLQQAMPSWFQMLLDQPHMRLVQL